MVFLYRRFLYCGCVLQCWTAQVLRVPVRNLRMIQKSDILSCKSSSDPGEIAIVLLCDGPRSTCGWPFMPSNWKYKFHLVIPHGTENPNQFWKKEEMDFGSYGPAPSYVVLPRPWGVRTAFLSSCRGPTTTAFRSCRWPEYLLFIICLFLLGIWHSLSSIS